MKSPPQPDFQPIFVQRNTVDVAPSRRQNLLVANGHSQITPSFGQNAPTTKDSSMNDKNGQKIGQGSAKTSGYSRTALGACAGLGVLTLLWAYWDPLVKYLNIGANRPRLGTQARLFARLFGSPIRNISVVVSPGQTQNRRMSPPPGGGLLLVGFASASPVGRSPAVISSGSITSPCFPCSRVCACSLVASKS